MKLLAVDYGLSRTGLAVSDPSGTIATPIAHIPSRNEDRMLASLLEVIQNVEPDKIIIGLPLRTDMKKSDMAERICSFASRLKEASGLDVEFQNEMYTTVIASKLLHENEKNAKKQRPLIDSAAAAVLLQAYLDNMKKKN